VIHYSDPPLLLRNVIPKLEDARALLAANAPYTPLGGWYTPDAELDVASSPMWFQNDFVHADLQVPGSELFLHHPRYISATQDFYGAQVVEPHSVYVNLMAGIEKAGPAHTDNPRFNGRDRSNTPMWLLRTMLWSGLFDEEAIVQATSIWWMNDVEGGEFLYWPDGPDKPPHRHHGEMANTALLGDNHGMFHQVGAVGPFDKGTRLVTPRAELAPVDAADATGDWAVRDRGEIHYRAPLEAFRVSVLWKADVYRDEAEKQRRAENPLSFEMIGEVFDRDFEQRGIKLRFDLSRLEDLGFAAAVAEHYPEATPFGAAPSYYEPAA